MSFLTGPRTELIDEYLIQRRRKGRFIIPIGEQVLHLSDITKQKSSSMNDMIVLTIRKAPLVIGEDKKASFIALIEYCLVDYKYKYGCNKEGIPYGIPRLKKFFDNAYGYKLEKQGTTQDELIEGIVQQGLNFKKVEFNAVIRHKKRLAKDALGEVVTKKRGSMVKIGQPIINYDTDLWMISKIDCPIDLPVIQHKSLIVPLSTQDQNEYAKLLNEKIECDYKQGFL